MKGKKKYNEDQVNVNGQEFSDLVPDREFPQVPVCS